jgi:ribonuclease HII
MDLLSFDKSYDVPICGIDEVGRGPLAGPVTAACVYIPPESLEKAPTLLLMNDSKQLSSKKRELLAAEIKTHCIWGIGEADNKEIDEINILQATYQAMRRAAAQMLKKAPSLKANLALIDGNRIPIGLEFKNTEAIIKGDSKSLSIAAASILAKVTRDTYMVELAKDYPHYGWESNAGYGANKHKEAISKYGPSPFHRMSFAPLKDKF